MVVFDFHLLENIRSIELQVVGSISNADWQDRVRQKMEAPIAEDLKLMTALRANRGGPALRKQIVRCEINSGPT